MYSGAVSASFTSSRGSVLPVVLQLAPEEVKRRLDSGEEIVLLDVREPHELALASLPGALYIPIREVPERSREVPRGKPVVVVCHHGARSLQVTWFLSQRGWKNVANLAGGIDAWSQRVDPAVPRY